MMANWVEGLLILCEKRYIRISIRAVHKISAAQPERITLFNSMFSQDCFLTGLIYFQNRSGL